MNRIIAKARLLNLAPIHDIPAAEESEPSFEFHEANSWIFYGDGDMYGSGAHGDGGIYLNGGFMKPRWTNGYRNSAEVTI